MKKFLKFIAALIILFLLLFGGYYLLNNEQLPIGEQGAKADALATKMLKALHQEAYENTEVLEWSFRNKHHYKWLKKEHIVHVKWDNVHVILHTKNSSKNTVFVNEVHVKDTELIEKATHYFNNDSFWLVAPFKVFDSGTERRLVRYQNREALLITYVSGGSTPGDSYLWILDKNFMPTSYKMWTKIIPIGGVTASWNQWKTTEAGIQLPTSHSIHLVGGISLNMGVVKAYNPKANALASKILKAIHHDAYQKTRYLEWSFAGKRHYKWDKKKHIVRVSWDTIQVQLHPNNIENSIVFFNTKMQSTIDISIVKKAEKFFNNDSFWLVAPHKLFEKGIKRSIQKEGGKESLLVNYTIGGTTPGDSYLWTLDTNYIPISYKMYVPSMKMNGVKATWEGWITTTSGTLLPTNHTFSSNRTLSMGNVKGY